jgi:hypothetical protein
MHERRPADADIDDNSDRRVHIDEFGYLDFGYPDFDYVDADSGLVYPDVDGTVYRDGDTHGHDHADGYADDTNRYLDTDRLVCSDIDGFLHSDRHVDAHEFVVPDDDVPDDDPVNCDADLHPDADANPVRQARWRRTR